MIRECRRRFFGFVMIYGKIPLAEDGGYRCQKKDRADGRCELLFTALMGGFMRYARRGIRARRGAVAGNIRMRI